MKKRYFPAIVIFVCFATFAGQKRVFILSGQSNMSGFGKRSELTPAEISAYTFSNVKIYGAEPWAGCSYVDGVALTPGIFCKITMNIPYNLSDTIPKDADGHPVAQFTIGPELGIAKVLVRRYPSDEIILIKAAWGGTGLENNWLNPNDPNRPMTYAWFRSVVQTSLLKIHGSYKICGMIWMQGESDACGHDAFGNIMPTANGLAMAQKYSDNLKVFVEQKIRGDMVSVHPGFSKIPFVYGGIGGGWEYVAIVQGQQRLAKTKISSARYISETIDSHRWEDGRWDRGAGFGTAHYTSQGTLDVGNYLGKGMVRLLDGFFFGALSTLRN